MLRKGRPVKLNKQVLRVGKKGYASVIFLGDIHHGHPTSLTERVVDLIDYCCRHNIYVLGMGDYLECGITGAVGDSVYAQRLNPQRQMEEVIEFFKPLAERRLLLGLLEGNHEARIYKSTGINVVKVMAGILGVPYLFSACWNLFRVGKQNYTVYALHGASGSRFIYTKLKAVTDISHYFAADVVCMGHVHDLASTTVERQRVNMRNKIIEYYKQYVVLTGHYLGYQLSYAQQKGYPPSKVGSPKLKFYANEKDVHIRL